MAVLTIEVDQELVDGATSIASESGTDLESVMQELLRQMVDEQRIPLRYYEYHEPNEESLESIAEAKCLIEAGGPSYKSAEEMFKAMGITI